MNVLAVKKNKNKNPSLYSIHINPKSLVFDWESDVFIGAVRIHFESVSFKPLPLSTPSISQGWMNEIHNYDPEMYHATLTHSVYVRLEGSVLRLSKPNRNISRRATHNEPKPDVTYISQKIYDLTDSKVWWLWVYVLCFCACL